MKRRPPNSLPTSCLPKDLWIEEREAWQTGYRCVVGIDEAGRGALAGPIVAACVVLPLGVAPKGINDSKLLTPEERESLFEPICTMARAYAIAQVDSAEIDKQNILRATHIAMRLALQSLPPGTLPDVALIDGRPVRPFPIDQLAIVGGDGLSASIACASILAKVFRDRLMIAYDLELPGYGFAQHKGYGTQSHLDALQRLGASRIHRRSYRPVQEVIHRILNAPNENEK